MKNYKYDPAISLKIKHPYDIKLHHFQGAQIGEDEGNNEDDMDEIVDRKFEMLKW